MKRCLLVVSALLFSSGCDITGIKGIEKISTSRYFLHITSLDQITEYKQIARVPGSVYVIVDALPELDDKEYVRLFAGCPNITDLEIKREFSSIPYGVPWGRTP